jgi:hypothetical protein
MASVGSGPSDEDPSAGRPPYPELAGPELLRPELLGPAPDPATVGFISGRSRIPADVPRPGSATVRPVRSRDAFKPYVAPPVTRRRRSDWPVLVFALVAAILVMAICCIAGFAVYVKHGGTFGG